MSSWSLDGITLDSRLKVSVPKPARVMRNVVVFFLVVGIFALVVTPWQQTSYGEGRVLAYSAVDRQQRIDAPIDGRVLKWYVTEGTRVKEGEPIVDLTDNDPQILARLESERTAIHARVVAAKAKLEALESKMGSVRDSREHALNAAKARVKMATQKVASAEQSVEAADANRITARKNIDRQRSLFEQGLASQRAKELAELDMAKADAELRKAEAALVEAQEEKLSKDHDLTTLGNTTTASIADARASMASAESDIAKGEADLARIDVRLARQSTQSIKASRDGTIFRIIANAHVGEIVKAGDMLAVIVPETEDRAVELLIDGNDVPLISLGQHVRLQFEGWPAIQFSGWPSVAVGTFGARVKLVDPTDDGKGKFRIVVVPDGDWPPPAYLRQGVRAHGWVLLGRVRLGYELWRRMNGFPPTVERPNQFVKDKPKSTTKSVDNVKDDGEKEE